jgi:succinoglycan biosynthesis protein ExoM
MRSASACAAESDAVVVICVATYRRPLGLSRLLEGLARLQFRSAPGPVIRVVVVDNDPAGSAAATIRKYEPAFPWALTYAVEVNQGIPHARNRAVAAAGEDVDFLAFIDDDEAPGPGWLDELLAVQRRFDADVVAGPVVPSFEVVPPRWVVRGRFFERPRYRTGTSLDFFATNNLLIRRSTLLLHSPPFDGRFAETGGSDTHLAVRMRGAGVKSIWADEAIVTEWHPPTRVTAGWILRRAFRLGTSLSMVERCVGAGPAARALRLVKGVARITLGILLLPGIVTGRARGLRAARNVCFGAGMIGGLAGGEYAEYRTLHGS